MRVEQFASSVSLVLPAASVTSMRLLELSYCMEHLAATSRPLRTRSPVKLPVSALPSNDAAAAATVADDEADDCPSVRLVCCSVNRSVRMLGRRALMATAPHASLRRRRNDTIRCLIDRGLLPPEIGGPAPPLEPVPAADEASSPGTPRYVVGWIFRC